MRMRPYLVALIFLPALLLGSTGCSAGCIKYKVASQAVLSQFMTLHQQALAQSGNDLARTLDAMRKLRSDYELKPMQDCAINVKLAVVSAMNLSLDNDTRLANRQLVLNSPDGHLGSDLAGIAFRRAQEEIDRLK